jgi:hypothetical protein
MGKMLRRILALPLGGGAQQGINRDLVEHVKQL